MEQNYDLLKFACNAPIGQFKDLSNAEVVDTVDGVYIFRENVNSKILAVAHLDTVLNSNYFMIGQNKKKKGGGARVYSRQLDDRLGVYIILNLLPKLGIEFDLLLTEGEESGRSTAQHFVTEKEYNWAFSFDRRGEDVVSYQYEDDEWNSTLEKSGFKVGIGSFSDIAFLDELGVKCVNIGTGYHGEHTKDCHVNIVEMERQVLRFKDFYESNKDTKFPHVYNPNYYANRYYGGWESEEWEKTTVSPTWGRWKYKFEYVPCHICMMEEGTEEIEDGILVCPSCYGQIAICDRCENFVLDTDIMGGICRDCDFELQFGTGRNNPFGR